MPRGPRGEKRRPRDPNQLAKLIVDIATGQVEDREPTGNQLRARKGGSAQGSRGDRRNCSNVSRRCRTRPAGLQAQVEGGGRGWVRELLVPFFGMRGGGPLFARMGTHAELARRRRQRRADEVDPGRAGGPARAAGRPWAVECRLSMDGAPQSARVACCRMEVAMAAAVGDLPVVHEAREAGAHSVVYRRKRFSAPSQKASRNRRITTRKLRSFVEV
jgi:hypothetical protein